MHQPATTGNGSSTQISSQRPRPPLPSPPLPPPCRKPRGFYSCALWLLQPTVFPQHPRPSPCLHSAPLRFLCHTAPEGPFSLADHPGHLPGPEHCCGLAWAPVHLQPCLPCFPRHSLETPMADFQKDATLLTLRQPSLPARTPETELMLCPSRSPLT